MSTAGEQRGTRAVRVLVVCAVNGHGGPVRSMTTVLRHTSATSARVWVATQVAGPGQPSTALERQAQGGLSMPRPRGLGLVRAQLTLLRRAGWIRRSFDVIHANSLTEVAVVLPTAIVTRRRVVVWVHNFERPAAFRVIEWMLPFIARHWTWRAVSKMSAELVHRAHPTLLPNPIDRDVVAQERTASTELRVTYLAGSDRYYKGFDLLPAIIRAAGTSGIEWSIYTSAPYSSTDDACRAAWGELLAMPAPAVQVYPRTQNVAAAFAETDVLLAPSRQESFNRAVAEALANSIPVVASDLEPHRELLGEAGLLFPVGDSACAGQLLRSLASDPDLLARLRQAAKARAHRYEPAAIAVELLGLWRG